MQVQGYSQPEKISDFDLMTELDTCFKQSAAQLTSGILESSNPQIRQFFQRALQTRLDQQRRLAQMMTQLGFYRPLPASQEMVQLARDQIQMAGAQIGGPFTAGAAPVGQPGVASPTVGTGPVAAQIPHL